jgi:uncharacterized protein YdeI (YjbR/CyaY-like superfamily)
MSTMNPKVDWYFNRSNKWQQEVELLRMIILDTGLNEVLKWGCPCYTWDKKNIILIHDFKDYCAVLFFKGALLKDPKKVLIQQTKNVQAARQMRFTSVKEITKLEKTLKSYIQEAIAAEKAGLKVALKKTDSFDMPEEFKKKLDKSAALRKAFYALTPGRQRGYLLHFSSAKQAKTREDRVKKLIPNIMKGKGWDEK